MKHSLTIGITDCKKYYDYEKWLTDAGASVLRLGHHDKKLKDLDKCNGILLSGGDEDIHPRFYYKSEYAEYCHGFDERRDEFELELFQRIEDKKLPVLGICRGLQIVNVFFGGTLIPDIPSFGKFNHSKFPAKDRYHSVQVDPNSDLHKIVGLEKGEVNSAHHQCAELVGKGLVASAISPDGIVESLERKNKDGKGFLLLVQWHPERKIDQQSAFSKNIKTSFLEAVKEWNG